MKSRRALLCLAVLVFLGSLAQPPRAPAQEKKPPQPVTPKEKLFVRENLVAWCIVPFDAKKRGPAERAEMLRRLGFSKFAYDYRAEHIPTFDAEMEALAKQKIELVAWWFPPTLNDEARGILDVLQRHKLKVQLWVTGGGEPTKSADEQRQRVVAEAARIRPIAAEAAKIGCTVALYNHGGWFGEPENELAIIDELKLPSVGIVYNLHHGHDHLERFPAVLAKMLPHLVCLNLNGMVADGERQGRKILPLGQGDLDLALLKTIVASGYRGPIGILGHTQDDAEERLQDNLDGLDWLVKQLDGSPAGPRPKPRTPVPAADPNKQAAANKAGSGPAKSIENHWGRAMIGLDWQESDSVDGRWNQTDVGPFLASTLPLPDMLPVAKGLSIRVGDRSQAAVCYDTQSLAWRAGWTKGFLKFNPARYGLINSPAIEGELAVASRAGNGWLGQEVRYEGLMLNRPRVVLAGRVAGRQILESPWLEEAEGLTIFTRTLDTLPGKINTPCVVGQFVGDGRVAEVGGVRLAMVGKEGKVVACAAAGAAELRLVPHERIGQVSIMADLAPTETRRQAKLLVWSGDEKQLPKFAAAVKASPPPEDLYKLAQPGKPRWTAEIVTKGVPSRDALSPYVVDTLTLPFDNPYKALLFVSGHDFFSNGDIALCTVHGDVWRVSGIDDRLERLVWKRFATGLFQPLGLKIVEDRVYVVGRDQITRLSDLNGDGEADGYDAFCNLYPTSTSAHDFVTCLETDSAGNFYLLHAVQGVVRVAKDGTSAVPIATGLRNPNGMSIGPGDVITASPQEGEWTPGSAIYEVRPGGHYGYGGPRPGHGAEGFDPPLVWLPRMMDNSSGGQVWVRNEHWGPLGAGPGVKGQWSDGQLLHLMYGKCRMALVLRETIGQSSQGAVCELPLNFASGVMRGRFSPADGQLYVSGLRGWATAAVDDGCLQRVRYTGRPFVVPISRQTYANGLAIGFSQPLDPQTAEDPGSYHAEQWNFHYAATYGSPDWKVTDPAVEGRDQVAVRSATLLDSGRTVFLEIPGFRTANLTSIEYSLQTADRQPLRQTLVATTYAIPERRMDERELHRPAPAAEVVDESHLAPGVMVRTSQGEAVSVRAARLVAWHIPPGQAAGGGLQPGSFTALAAGYINVPLRGEYRFHFTGQGTAKLRINGRPLLDVAGDLTAAAPAAAMLHQGYNRLQVEYASPAEGPAALRLWWTDGTFADEPIPPTALYHDDRDEALRAADQLRRGVWLAGERRCAACHDLPGSKEPLQPNGPSLAGAGSRLSPRWIYQWLLDPAAIRPETHMPRLFAADQPADRQAAADIAAYLASLGEPVAANLPVANDSPSPPGAALFEDLGCIACHRLTPPAEDDRYSRLPLAHVGQKFASGALAQFLARPHEHYPQSRMPDFALSPAEAKTLAEHLTGGEQVKLPAVPELDKADPRRGETAFREKRCQACHATAERAAASPTSPALVPLADLARGCLAADRATRGTALDFGLTAAQASDLRALYSRHDAGGLPVLAGEMLPQLLASLRCGACHSRDHEVAPLRRIVAEESEHGLAPDALPNLTWAGEKLHGGWMVNLLEGKLPVHTRPWLKARMPAFPPYSRLLAESLVAEHGLPFSHGNKFPPNEPPLASIGDRLTRKGGLDCRSCHAVGQDQPTGDERTKPAQGINFARVRERMPSDFFQRFVLDPPRHDVTTRMPKLSPDGRATNATAILDGDARQQFEAIWQYILTVRD